MPVKNENVSPLTTNDVVSVIWEDCYDKYFGYPEGDRERLANECTLASLKLLGIEESKALDLLSELLRA